MSKRRRLASRSRSADSRRMPFPSSAARVSFWSSRTIDVAFMDAAASNVLERVSCGFLQSLLIEQLGDPVAHGTRRFVRRCEIVHGEDLATHAADAGCFVHVGTRCGQPFT
jgi:hypothetical protein